MRSSSRIRPTGSAADRERGAHHHPERRACERLKPRDHAWTRFARFATVDIASQRSAYRQPLEPSARTLADELGPDCDVVLLGSIASPKYVECSSTIFGDRLLFPTRLRRPR